MRILLTGATGYIGKRLLPVLLEEGHEVICCVRNAANFKLKRGWKGRVSVFEVDFLEEVDLIAAPRDFDVAYYLIHSMSAAINDFKSLEERSAWNFRHFVEKSSCRQVIYLTGIVNNDELSNHLESRLQVERV
ncbi:MAG: NAD(P)H-binding protein, partial [Phaeodactylibacter sp.]|nr:NAD(P)H-binding protein [Phaeodactylibacter sp.]